MTGLDPRSEAQKQLASKNVDFEILSLTNVTSSGRSVLARMLNRGFLPILIEAPDLGSNTISLYAPDFEYLENGKWKSTGLAHDGIRPATNLNFQAEVFFVAPLPTNKWDEKVEFRLIYYPFVSKPTSISRLNKPK